MDGAKVLHNLKKLLISPRNKLYKSINKGEFVVGTFKINNAKYNIFVFCSRDAEKIERTREQKTKIIFVVSIQKIQTFSKFKIMHLVMQDLKHYHY